MSGRAEKIRSGGASILSTILNVYLCSQGIPSEQADMIGTVSEVILCNIPFPERKTLGKRLESVISRSWDTVESRYEIPSDCLSDLRLNVLTLTNVQSYCRAHDPVSELSESMRCICSKHSSCNVETLPFFEISKTLISALEKHILADDLLVKAQLLENDKEILSLLREQTNFHSDKQPAFASPPRNHFSLLSQTGTRRYLTHYLKETETRGYSLSPRYFLTNIRKLLVNHAHILVYGNGGMGKTEFMKNVGDLDIQADRYIVNLNYITYKERRNAPPLSENSKSSSAIFRCIEDQYPAITYHAFLESLEQESTVILMDGLNEIKAEYREFFLDELSVILKYPCRVIITTRSPAKRLLGSLAASFKVYELTTKDRRVDSLVLKLKGTSPCLAELARAPMYYYIISDLIREGQFDTGKYIGKYSLLEVLFSSTFEHQMKKAEDWDHKNVLKIAVWMILPWMAHDFSLSGDFDIPDSMFRRRIKEKLSLLKGLSNADFQQEYTYSSDHLADSGFACWQTLQSISEDILTDCAVNALRGFESFVRMDDAAHRVGFRHQDLRDYAAAIYYRKRFQMIRDTPAEADRRPPLEEKTDTLIVHLDHSTTDFILCAVLNPASVEKEAYRKAYGEVFSKESAAALSGSSLSGFLCWCEMTLQVGEALMRDDASHLKATMFQEYRDSTKHLLDMIVDQEMVSDNSLTDADRIRMDKILLKGAEMYRREQSFEKAAKMVGLAKQNGSYMKDPVYPERIRYKAMHHLSKIELCRYQYESEILGTLQTDKQIQTAKQALDTLHICAVQGRFIYSANMMGYFYSVPVPCIRRLFKKIGYHVDYPKSFWYFYHVVFENGKLTHRKQEAAYSIRECISQLLFGKVTICKGRYDRIQEDSIHLAACASLSEVKERDVDIAGSLLAQIQNTTVPLLQVYSGLIALYHGEYQTALESFLCEKNELLSMVATRKLFQDIPQVRRAVQDLPEPERLTDSIRTRLQAVHGKMQRPLGIDERDPRFILEQVYFLDPEWAEEDALP